MSGRSRSYKTGLYLSLQDDIEAMSYLQAALEDSTHAFLVALRDVAEARNITKIAKESNLDRVNIYRMLSEKGNPTLSSLWKILNALGLRLSVEEANRPEPNLTANQWRTSWHVSSRSKKTLACYAGTGKSKVFLSHAVEVPDLEHSFAANAEDRYSEVAWESEELCEMAF
jgi:probable addiction module antidote protein